MAAADRQTKEENGERKTENGRTEEQKKGVWAVYSDMSRILVARHSMRVMGKCTTRVREQAARSGGRLALALLVRDGRVHRVLAPVVPNARELGEPRRAHEEVDGCEGVVDWGDDKRVP